MTEIKFIKTHPNSKDLSGQTFGRLTAIGPVERTKRSNIKWLCICECGTEHIAIVANMINGTVRSCGCLRSENTTRMKTTHGMSYSPEYKVRSGMISRCYQPDAINYDRYGGRGITVCKEWRDSFESFYADMGKRPSKAHELERIDNSLGYSADNCVWATRSQNCRNKRNNRMLTMNGKTQCMAAWSDDIGIATNTLFMRLSYGWSIERTLTEPVNSH